MIYSKPILIPSLIARVAVSSPANQDKTLLFFSEMCNLLNGKILWSHFLLRLRPITVFSSPLGLPFGIRGGGNFRVVISVTIGRGVGVVTGDEVREMLELEVTEEGWEETTKGEAGIVLADVTELDLIDIGMTDKSIGLVMVQEETP